MKLHMPTYKKIRWNGHKVSIFVEEGDTFRLLLSIIAPIVPYFWDTNINLDMAVEPPKNIEQIEGRSLQYKWELLDLDDKVIRSGQDSYDFSLRGERKHRAIKIGFLKPQQCYRLNVILTDIYGNTSEPLQMATFTIKDRDELYMQVFIAILAIIMALILGFVVRGCS
jgi:hypothetical protein